MSTPVYPALNGTLLRRRRAELGLSARRVADALGMPAPTYLALESGRGAETVEFRMAARIAEILGLSLDGLVVWPREHQESETSDADVSKTGDDAAQLGALLYAAGTLTPVGSLCEVLGWDYDRFHAAEEVLRQHLAGCGLRLHRQTERLSIARGAEAVDEGALKSMVRRQLARENVSASEARMVRRIQQGRVPQSPSNAEAVTFGVLVNAGLVTFAEASRRVTEREMVLSDDVRYSLMLS